MFTKEWLECEEANRRAREAAGHPSPPAAPVVETPIPDDWAGMFIPGGDGMAFQRRHYEETLKNPPDPSLWQTISPEQAKARMAEMQASIRQQNDAAGLKDIREQAARSPAERQQKIMEAFVQLLEAYVDDN